MIKSNKNRPFTKKGELKIKKHIFLGKYSKLKDMILLIIKLRINK